MKRERITSLEDLDRHLGMKHNDYFMSNGLFRSSKEIYEGNKEGTYYIFNFIDDTDEVLTKEQMMDEEYTNIGKAIANGAFFVEYFEDE